MSQGGIYDHLGGGFARYSTDEVWLVPHFEKMLYDNAQLLELLALAHADRPNPLYAQRAMETVGWMMRDMSAQPVDGKAAFAASEDADSEGEEGRFYVWTEAEVDALLGPEAAAFKRSLRRDRRPAIGRGTPSCAGSRQPVRRIRRLGLPARGMCCSGRGKSGCGRDGTTRCWPTGTGWRSPRWRVAPRCLARPAWLGRAREAFDFILTQMSRRAWRCRACMAARPGHGTGFDRGSGGDGACGARPV